MENYQLFNREIGLFDCYAVSTRFDYERGNELRVLIDTYIYTWSNKHHVGITWKLSSLLSSLHFTSYNFPHNRNIYIYIVLTRPRYNVNETSPLII